MCIYTYTRCAQQARRFREQACRAADLHLRAQRKPPALGTYTYTYTYTHTHTHVYTYTYAHIHVHVHTHVYMYTYIHTHAALGGPQPARYIHIHTYTCTHAHMHIPGRPQPARAAVYRATHLLTSSSLLTYLLPYLLRWAAIRSSGRLSSRRGRGWVPSVATLASRAARASTRT